MDKKNYKRLREGEYKSIARDLFESMKGKLAMDQTNTIVLATILLDLQKNNIEIEKNTYLEKSMYSDEVKNIIERYIDIVWEIVVEKLDKYSEDELLSLIINYENDMEIYTPIGISNLAQNILDIKDNETVLNICSGTGNFEMESILHNKAKYKGIEINYSNNEVSTLRKEILDIDAEFIREDALKFEYDKKYDKIFSNYPFNISIINMNEIKTNISEKFNISNEILKRVSSEWLYNVIIIESIKESGKAVVIMSNGNTWNNRYKDIRKYFIENKYIETVISLPERIFNGTNIGTTMMVFSKNNKKIRFVDARNICEIGRVKNSITESDVDKIINLINNDNELSIEVGYDEISDDEYTLNAIKYIEKVPEFENGVEFKSIIKGIRRGLQIKADDLDNMKSKVMTKDKYVTLSNIEDGMIEFKEEQYLSEIPENMYKYCINNEEMIISKIGNNNFKSTVIENLAEDEKLLSTGNMFIIEFDKQKVNPLYIQALFSSNLGEEIFKGVYTGTVISTISVEKLKKMIIPLPDKDEQDIIANKYMANLDEIIMLKRKLERVKERIKSTFEECE